MNQAAGPAATEIAPAAAQESPWTPGVMACVAVIGLAGAGLALAPAVVFSYAVPLLVLAFGCTAAVRWKRAGVRRELRSRVAARIAGFGGGVYGMLAMATWLQLESADLAADVAAAGSLGAFVDSLSLGWLISQSMESIGFAIRAGLWPWHWLSGYGMPAVVLAAAAAAGLDALLKAAFPRYCAYREPVEAKST